MLDEKINYHPLKNRYFKHFVYALILPLYLAAFFSIEHFIGNDYPTSQMFLSHVPFDDIIPFLDFMVIFYVMWFPALGITGVYLMLFDVRGFKRYMTYIFFSFFTMVIVCVIFPNYQDMRPAITGDENLFCRLLKTLYDTDTCTNVLPSAHVFGSAAVMFAVFDCKNLKKHLWLKISATVISVMISVSTVFVKQHSILDIIIAVPIAAIWWAVVYRMMFKDVKKADFKCSEPQSSDKNQY